jgi:hypothetical protein
MGETDIDKFPEKPIAAAPPQDWEEYIDNEIQSVKHAYSDLRKHAVKNYDGECTPGREGINPGRWYMQPKYVEIWVEGGNLLKTINVLKGDKKVHVVAFGGIGSTTRLYKHCMRVKQIKDIHKHIKKIVILYCGDFDSTGDWLDDYITNAIHFYTGMKNKQDYELKRVAILPQQIDEYNLVEDPEYNPEENEDPRFKKFKLKPKVIPLIKKYGEKFGVQVEAMLTTKEMIDTFKEILQDAIDEQWDEKIFEENCHDKKYNYEANDEIEPEDIDI